jgi:hypothetical protein
VLHAKRITKELEDYKRKVEFSEGVVKDLQSTGNESVDSLLGMLKKYKRQARDTQDEIVKLNKLILIKEAEITTVTEEVNTLKELKTNMGVEGKQKQQNAARMIEENNAVIKRQDKLIVDLHQKNQVCEYKIMETQEEKTKKEKEKNALEMRLMELEDKRRLMSEHINATENRLGLYKEHLIKRDEETARRRKAEIEEQKRRNEAEKAGGNKPLKSNFKKQKAKAKETVSPQDGVSVAAKSVTSH